MPITVFCGTWWHSKRCLMGRDHKSVIMGCQCWSRSNKVLQTLWPIVTHCWGKIYMVTFKCLIGQLMPDPVLLWLYWLILVSKLSLFFGKLFSCGKSRRALFLLLLVLVALGLTIALVVAGITDKLELTLATGWGGAELPSDVSVIVVSVSSNTISSGPVNSIVVTVLSVSNSIPSGV